MESDTIIACSCGAQVRLPTDAAQRVFRCPACKSALALTLDAKVLSSRQLTAGEPGATCPICQTAVAADEFVVSCPVCDQVHHRECWSEIGGCGTYGCTQAPKIEKSEASAPTATSAWGDTKTCPMCGEKIKSIALRCRYCESDFDTAEPQTMIDLHRRAGRIREQRALKTNTAWLFALSLTGCLGPLIGLISSAYLLPKREELSKCGPLYSFLAWGALIISGLFTVLIAVAVLFDLT
ncbi:MAG: RING finger protein [Planctomycetaceae bacterium]